MQRPAAIAAITLCTISHAQTPCAGTALRFGYPVAARLAGETRGATPLIDDLSIAPATYHTRHAPAIGNGRAWSTGSVFGGTLPTPAWPGSGDPAVHFGVTDPNRTLAFARRGGIAIGFSPWGTFANNDQRDLAAARNAWLSRRGLVGGVRTFTKPIPVNRRPAATARRTLEAATRVSTPPHWGWEN